MFRLAAFAAALWLSPFVPAGDVTGDELPSFSAQTRVFAEDQASPYLEHRIVFIGGIAYDFTIHPATHTRFVTIFDPDSRRITLLDRKDQVRCVVPTDRLLELTAKARMASDDPTQREHLGLLSKAQREDSGDVAVRYSKASYVTSTLKPANREIARQFAQFSDWALRLNIARRIDSPPPFARMTLNRALAREGQVPASMTITFRRQPKEQHFRVEHDWSQQSSARDRELANQIDGLIPTYQEVPLDQFPTE